MVIFDVCPAWGLRILKTRLLWADYSGEQELGLKKLKCPKSTLEKSLPSIPQVLGDFQNSENFDSDNFCHLFPLPSWRELLDVCALHFLPPWASSLLCAPQVTSVWPRSGTTQWLWFDLRSLLTFLHCTSTPRHMSAPANQVEANYVLMAGFQYSALKGAVVLCIQTLYIKALPNWGYTYTHGCCRLIRNLRPWCDLPNEKLRVVFKQTF